MLWGQLSAAVPASSVDADLKFGCPREELTATSAMIGKLSAEVQTGRDQLKYNRRRAVDQYSRAVDERLKPKSSHSREVLALEKSVEELKSKAFAAVDAETLTGEKNTEPAVRLAGEDTRPSRITYAWARVITCMDGLCTGVDAIIMRLSDVMDQLRLDLTNLVRDNPRSSSK